MKSNIKKSNMKMTLKLAGAVLVLLIAGSTVLNAQRDKNSQVVDTTRLKQMQLWMKHHPDMFQNPDSAMMRGMGPGMMMQGMCPCMRMMGGMNQGRMMHERMYQGPGFGRSHQEGRPEMGQRRHGMGPGLIKDIPNLTDKQKKEIEELTQKQQEEMQKFRDEHQKKMDSMRETHRNAIINLLTPDQKKWVEENMPAIK
jgi:hypothetical protein